MVFLEVGTYPVYLFHIVCHTYYYYYLGKP